MLRSRSRPVTAGLSGKAMICPSSHAARSWPGSANCGTEPGGCRTSSAEPLAPCSAIRRSSSGAVVAVQAHDLPPREHLPVVVGGVVAELEQPAVGLRVTGEAGVEVDLGPARALAERPQHALQVADPHVVGDERVVLAAERVLGELEVAPGRLERLGAVEALVDLRPLGAQLADLVLVPARALAVDPAAELGAARACRPSCRAGRSPCRRGSASARPRPRRRSA